MDVSTEKLKDLSLDEVNKLELQNSYLVTEYKAKTLEQNARKYWDLFYKRNETRFFKDRHWTITEFKELLEDYDTNTEKPMLLEVGCGVGNLIFPLIKENLNFYIYACDFSSKAIELIRNNELYNEKYMQAFVADITSNDVSSIIKNNSIEIVTFIFVLSAIHPEKFETVLKNIYCLLKPGGLVLFRDYGLYDMAQIRFKPGNKIGKNFYMRQDGTRYDIK